MAEVLFLGLTQSKPYRLQNELYRSQSAPYFSHTCNYSYRGKRVQDNLCKTRPQKDHKSVPHREISVQLPYTAY